MITLQKMTRAEEKVMRIIWNAEIPVTVSEVQKLVSSENSEWQHTTVATFMQKLCQKGILIAKKKGNTNLYYPEISKEEYLSFETISFVKDVHHGSITSFVAALCRDGSKLSLTKEDSEEIRKLIEQKE